MSKRAVSVTLDESNLVWLKGLTERSGARSLSDTLDRIVTAAREDGAVAGHAAHSVVGTIDISAADPSLDEADVIVRDLFARSLARPMLAKESRALLKPSRPRRG
jgi:hypothetical protein